MLVVKVETDFFTGEFLHQSEIPTKSIPEWGLQGNLVQILMIALLDQSQKAEFEELKFSQVMKIWNVYRLAKPIKREVSNDLSEWM